jgi:plasmid stabilization system protein ParE
MQARFLKPAEAEVEEAIAYFDEQREGLGERFERDLMDTVAFIVERPLTGTSLAERVRKFRLRTFRYNVIYFVDVDEIVIVAVAHHRRRPGYWRDRFADMR